MIYINDLSNDLSTNSKLFTDDTLIHSTFSVVRDIKTLATHLNNDLRKISNSALQWKLSFNPNTNKKAQEVIFSHKLQKINFPCIYFNKNPIKQISFQKHLGMILDTKLNFQEDLKLQKINLPSIYFNNNPIRQVSSQKHLGMISEAKSNFQEDLKNIKSEVNKTIGLLRKLQDILLRPSFLTIFKLFVRPHLHYDPVI